MMPARRYRRKNSHYSDPRLHVLTHTRNQGVGGAMLTGYDYALKQGLDIM